MTEKRKKLPKIEKLVSDLTQVGQVMTKNYMENLPGLMESGKEISNAWFAFEKNVSSKPEVKEKIQDSYFDFYKKQVEMWQEINKNMQVAPSPLLANADKRFKAAEWNESPYYFYFVKQTYLMVSEMATNIIDHATLDPELKQKLKFYTKLYLDALSPSNFLVTNPEAMKLAQTTNGESLVKGLQNLLHDIKLGKITQTDFSAFEVGKNLATTKGSVVFENDIIQLLQYKPLTKKVHETPLLVVPPLINRYYILDLEEHNSFVRYAVEQGFTVFIVSWCVPDAVRGKASFDDYVQKGVIDAIKVIKEITGQPKVNTCGYCIGGTLLGTAASVLASKKIQDINTTTFLASMLDFSDFGEMSVIIDLPLVEKLEKEIGNGGVIKGDDMNNAFKMLRANDMIWNYVVNNYLKGLDPTALSILHWNNDGCNLPGNMFTYYLRHMILGNQLSKKNALTICATPIDLSKIKTPSYVLATALDHISPPHTAFTTTRLVGGDVEFVLGESGHVAGIVNPPTENNKYGYYSNGELGIDLAHFKSTATHQKESWWIHWSKWLKGHSGKQINAPLKQGNVKYKVIEPAPGRYVKE